MKIGLFFGSFNPIHHGHLIIANIMAETTDLDEVWFVISPRNPFKPGNSLLHEFDRYDMVEAAIKGNDRFRVSDVEFHLPKPSYTINTLCYLSEKHPNHSFALIIGSDNLVNFRKWKNSDIILKNYDLYVYPRPGDVPSMDYIENADKARVHFVDAPLLNISATYIRNLIKEGKSIRYLTPDSVARIIAEKSFYR